MKKTLLALLTLASSQAFAHRLWLESNHIHGGEVLKAELGYGHFPVFEEIPEARLPIFKKGVQLIGKEGSQDLVQKGEKNYQFESKEGLANGSYLLSAEYAPTFWSKGKDGWKKDATLKTYEGAEHCEQSRMYAKQIVNVGHEAADVNDINKPLGHLVEIVPLDNPENVLVGQPFKVKVLYRGEPLVGEYVYATFKGFGTENVAPSHHKMEPQAFVDKTDKNGEVSIIPLRQGLWKAMVDYTTPYQDQAECLKETTYTTLTFQIGHQH